MSIDSTVSAPPIVRSASLDTSLLALSEATASLDAATAAQIDKDLHRAGRQDLGVKDADAERHREALRRLLNAWAAQPDEVYHQAMCFIAASLLVAENLDVERAYAAFVGVMCALPAGYYGEGLEGCRIEVRALRHLAARRWPEVYGKASIVNEPLDLVCTQWLLALFGSLLPPACCQALWIEMSESETEPSDLPLRVGLVLLGSVLKPLEEAISEDEAEEEVGGGCASYTVLQRAAPECSEDANALLAAAKAVKLAGTDLVDVRDKSRRELEAEDAIEKARKAIQRSAAVLEASSARGEASTSTGTRASSSQRPLVSSAHASSLVGHARSRRSGGSPCCSLPALVLTVAAIAAALLFGLATSSATVPYAIGLLMLVLMAVGLARKTPLRHCARAALDLFVRRPGEPGSLSHTLRRLRAARKPSLAGRDDAAAAAHAMDEGSADRSDSVMRPHRLE